MIQAVGIVRYFIELTLKFVVLPLSIYKLFFLRYILQLLKVCKYLKTISHVTLTDLQKIESLVFLFLKMYILLFFFCFLFYEYKVLKYLFLIYVGKLSISKCRSSLISELPKY